VCHLTQYYVDATLLAKSARKAVDVVAKVRALGVSGVAEVSLAVLSADQKGQ
jgi:hypothetical protein